MKRQAWFWMGLVGLGAIAPFFFSSSPASACTPHPDNPKGCDQVFKHKFPVGPRGGGGGDDPWPPDCAVCGKLKLERRDMLILPADDLQQQSRFGSQMINPQPLPPKVGGFQR